MLIELGYAIAHLGWNRIIMLFNTHYGGLKDAPFDINSHYIQPYYFSPNSEGEDKKKIQKTAYEKLKEVVLQNPRRPAEEAQLDPHKEKRRRDIFTMKSLLSTIHLQSLNTHIEEAPYKIYHRIFFFWEDFHALFSDNFFYLHDERLKDLVNRIHTEWNNTLSYDHQYNPSRGNDCYFFSNPGDAPLTNEQQQDWEAIEIALSHLRLASQELISYIRESYLEIDLEETNKNALNNYVSLMNTSIV